MLFDLHKDIDGLREEELAGGKIGTTRRGIGPAYASKAQRNGVRVGELRDMSKFADKLRRLVSWAVHKQACRALSSPARASMATLWLRSLHLQPHAIEILLS